MGIGGHMLGPKKLAKLQRKTGLPLDRAFIRNNYSEGVVRKDGKCSHYVINPRTGESAQVENPQHWSSCREAGFVS